MVSEVFGAEAAAFAERHAHNAAQRQIWAVLHELERQTRDAIYDRFGDTAARFATAARVANASGTANGAAVAVLPHRLRSSTTSWRTNSPSPSWADECSPTTTNP